MKRLSLFCVVLGLAGMAQAITFDWSQAADVSLTRDAASGVYTAADLDIAAGSAFAIQLTVHVANPADFNYYSTWYSNRAFLTLGNADGRQLTIDNRYHTQDRDQPMGVWAGGVYQTIDATLEMAAENRFVFAYDPEAREMTITQNGTLIATLDEKALPEFAAITTLSLAGWADADGTLHDAWAGSGLSPLDPDNWSIDNVSYTVSLLPEPTALALLALGVAGAALRRRAA